MTNKQAYQFRTAKNGVNLLLENCSTATTYTELITVFSTLLKFLNQANDKNKVENKGIIAFKNYFEVESPKKRSIEAVVKKRKMHTSKKINQSIKTFRDYIYEYKLLREKGLSYQKIAEYSKNVLNVKVSKTSLINLLKEV